MAKEIVLTGITTTGTPHIGNFVGAIRPAIDASRDPDVQSFYFLADYHALIKNQEPATMRQSSREVAAAWLALGLDTRNAVFYRQTDIPEIPELTWILTCMTAKGLMNRAHAYKAAVQENEEAGSGDPDKGITMGLFCYPILMAADILMFKARKIPVGRDQIQHIEMARDIAQRFNHLYGETFVLPEAVIDDNTAVLSGLDGRKMSKSYNNTIPLFAPEKRLRKLIMKIKTNSLPPEAPKDTGDCTLFEIYRAFADNAEIDGVRKRYAEGIGWGEMKQILFEKINGILEEPRRRYAELIDDPAHIEGVLREGAEKARAFSRPFLQEIRKAIGVQSVDA
jgi:tryptophanyl-tRNA synthetase